MKIKKISFFGFADAKEDSQLYKDAFAVAQVVAEAGYTVVDGGGPGLMRAFSQGAKSKNGWVVGVTFYPKDATNFEGRAKDNPLDEEVVTPNYVERTIKLLDQGDIYIVFNGGTGTISEFAMAWGLARLYFGHHKPLILYGKFWHNVIKAFVDNMLLRPEELAVFEIVDSPQGVVSAIKNFERRLEQETHWHEVSSEKPFRI